MPAFIRVAWMWARVGERPSERSSRHPEPHGRVSGGRRASRPCGERRDPVGEAGRDPGPRRRIGLGQILAGARSAATAASQGRRRPVRRPGSHENGRQGPARGATAVADDLPGPDRVAQSAPQGGRDHRRAADRVGRVGCRRAYPPRAQRDGGGGPRSRSRLEPPAARILRRPVPAHRHRACPRARAQPDRVRRAGFGARRLDPGADHQSAGGHEGPLRPHAPVHRPRSRGGEVGVRPGRGDVSRPALRGGRLGVAVRHARASLYGGADGSDPGAGPRHPPGRFQAEAG